VTMQVKYLDLPEQFRDEALRKILNEQFNACQFIMGPKVEEFEKNFSSVCQALYAVGLNSGTDALFLALKALGVGPGDEVITAPNSFVASTGAIVAAGARPVFVDVASDYNIDVNLIEPAITERTKAILPIHLTGNPADMGAIMEIAGKHKLLVVEDAAQAVMASINGKRVGSFGDAGCFSLHPLKNLNACGDGGVLTTNSHEVYEKVRLLRNHGLMNRDEIEIFGYNSRLDTLQAAVADYVLGKLESITACRIRNAQVYDGALKGIPDFVTLPPRRKNVEQVFHTYVLRVKRRDNLMRFLNERGVETKIHYPIPIHLQKPCLELGYRKGDFPVCEEQSSEILSLPVHHHLREDQIEYVIELIKKFYDIKI
jgi:dTDP-3-amino-2,3,6-trideoxy-4-keto-D-glucose/dTDP-3-amino-3,4,6-trideoxy-alpha-D-glucose/dTDP-2,6-dideoxy-D-kanosamine transaminase